MQQILYFADGIGLQGVWFRKCSNVSTTLLFPERISPPGDKKGRFSNETFPDERFFLVFAAFEKNDGCMIGKNVGAKICIIAKNWKKCWEMKSLLKNI